MNNTNNIIVVGTQLIHYNNGFIFSRLQMAIHGNLLFSVQYYIIVAKQISLLAHRVRHLIHYLFVLYIYIFFCFFISTSPVPDQPSVSFIIEERETRNLSSVSNYRSLTVIGSLAQSQIGSNILCTHALLLLLYTLSAREEKKIKIKTFV